MNRARVDLVTVLGLASGFALVISAMVLGGSPGAFFDVPSLLIVLGGTLAVTVASFSMDEIRAAGKAIARAVTDNRKDPRRAARTVIRLSEKARKDGILALQDLSPTFRQDPFLERAMGLVIDGAPTAEIEKILHSEVRAMTARHAKGAQILRRAAEVAPAMGLIGTLVGLVQMLGTLDDPSRIGPAMAVALLTTFYGAVLANMVFTPLANKLERNSDEETLMNTVYAVGATSIGRRENPRRLEMLLNALLPPSQRVRHFR